MLLILALTITAQSQDHPTTSPVVPVNSQTPDERASGQAFAKVIAEARDDNGHFIGEQGVRDALKASIAHEMILGANAEAVRKFGSLIRNLQQKIDRLESPPLSNSDAESVKKYRSLIKDVQDKIDKFETLSIPVDVQVLRYAKATMNEIQGNIDKLESPPLSTSDGESVEKYKSAIKETQDKIDKLKSLPYSGPHLQNLAKKMREVTDAYDLKGPRLKVNKQRLKLAQSLEKQGKIKGAMGYYETVVKDYDTFPFSPLKPTAEIARERLKALR